MIPDSGCPENCDQQFYEWVAEADCGVAVLATASQDEPTQEGSIFPPGERVFAIAAVRAGADDAFSIGPTAQADVEKAAKGEAQEGCKECGESAHGFLG